MIHHGAVASREKKIPRKPTQGRMKRTLGRPSCTDIFQNFIKFFMAEIFHHTVFMFDIDKFSNKTNSPSLALRNISEFQVLTVGWFDRIDTVQIAEIHGAGG